MTNKTYSLTRWSLLTGLLATSLASGASDLSIDRPAMHPPGTVTYDSISSLSETARSHFGASALAADNMSEPLLGRDIRLFEKYRERMRDSSSLAGKITIKMISIDRSPLEKYQFAGLIPEGPTREGPWTQFIRVFMRPDATPIFLHEWDFVAARGSIVVYKEFLNEQVGATPARLVVKRSGDGQAISELIWTTSKRSLKLSVWGDVINPGVNNPYDKRWLKSIAESLTDTGPEPVRD